MRGQEPLRSARGGAVSRASSTGLAAPLRPHVVSAVSVPGTPPRCAEVLLEELVTAESGAHGHAARRVMGVKSRLPAARYPDKLEEKSASWVRRATPWQRSAPCTSAGGRSGGFPGGAGGSQRRASPCKAVPRIRRLLHPVGNGESLGAQQLQRVGEAPLGPVGAAGGAAAAGNTRCPPPRGRLASQQRPPKARPWRPVQRSREEPARLARPHRTSLLNHRL